MNMHSGSLIAFYFALAAAAFGASPVADAAMKRDQNAVRSLIAEKADVNAPQADGATALQWAAYNNDLETAGLLIAAGANAKAANHDGATPLYLAALGGSAPMVDALLKAGADANEPGPQGESPLMLAARSGSLEAMKVLLEHKAAVNAKDKLRGTTALMWAAEQGHPSAVEFLIASGADVSAVSNPDFGGKPRNNIAVTKEQRAASKVRAAAAEAARNSRAAGGASARGRGANRDAATADDPDAEAAFFRQPSVKDGGGLTALVLAAREDCIECAAALLEAGADINQTTRYGWTPLLTATQNRHYKLAGYLLDHGANPNIANFGGWTPLYLATDNRNIESGDYPVRTPDMDHLDYIKLLIEKGANVNARVCGRESTAEKCVGDSTETRTNFTMQWLFEEGATPFLRAAQSGDVVLMKLLLARGANPKIYTAHNVTPLAAAAGNGWVEGVTFDWSPEETVEAVNLCLDLGIDPNIPDDEGRTALHGAAHKGRTDVIQVLVDHGADMLAHDEGSRDSIDGGLLGQTWIPLDWARGLVRVGVQSAIAHPEAEKLLVKLMTEHGLPVPPPPKDSRCLTQGVKGCQ
jgi:ankyrin repeat protein